MMVSIANPPGMWALLGLPAILLIHFLQRESRHAVTSTLFLLEQLQPVSAQGRRFESLRNSLPLWLQFLAVLLATWLLIQPRWIRKDSTQNAVIVLDSSVSMTAFRDPMLRELKKRMTAIGRAAANTEWVLLESDTTRGTIYSGGNLDALFAALEKWKPHLGSHDPTPALRVGQTLLHGSGILTFVTDRPRTVPEGVQLLAVGSPIENVGFAGLSIDNVETGSNWRALIKNNGTHPQRRHWRIESNGRALNAAQEVTLQPGESRELSGQFPSGENSCELVADGDAFALDDRLPIVRPQRKALSVQIGNDAAFAEFFEKFFASVENATRATSGGDLQILSCNSELPRGDWKRAIIFVADREERTRFLGGQIVAENHPLAADLHWQGLRTRDTSHFNLTEQDQVLVWQGDRSLIFLTGGGPAKSLVINFDLRQSNAAQLPAFVILLHRFVENVRAEKVAPETRNVETNQLLTVAADPLGPALAMTPGNVTDAGNALRASVEPGFFSVRQGDQTLLTAAAHFADAREADFRDAAEADSSGGKIGELVDRNSVHDFLAPLWTILLGAALLTSWAWIARIG
jgi:hypothetical protein